MAGRDGTDKPSPPAHGPSPDEPFLRRWSRRKQGREEEDSRDDARPDPPAGPVEDTRAADPPPVLRDEDMPDLASIDESNDVSPFFSPGVSEELRQAALRRLFRSPGFNVRDGLDDYDDDFRSFHALGDVVTTEMRRRWAREEARMQERLADNGEPPGETLDEGEESGPARAAHDDDTEGESDDRA